MSHPADPDRPVRVGGVAVITRAMATLAWTIVNGSDYDRREAAGVLAELILEATGEQ